MMSQQSATAIGTQIMNPDIGETISVCLLTYNHVDVIGSTLESILNQTISSYEVIVSDDYSDDGTWERILEFAGRDNRIKPFRTPHNMGMPGNANFAVSLSDRPYIALLHHDDLYRQDLLEKWAGVLERNSDVGFVFNHYDSLTPERHKRSRFSDECFEGNRFLENILFARWDSPVRGTAMIRRTLWNQLGGMRQEFDLVADVDLWMRIARVSRIGYVPERLIYVRTCRPDYYPDIYTGHTWHWRRLLLIYELHAANRLGYLRLNTIHGALQWFVFRVRLSCETAKWLGYGLVRKRIDMIASCHESTTQYDLWPLKAFRWVIQVMYNATR